MCLKLRRPVVALRLLAVFLQRTESAAQRQGFERRRELLHDKSEIPLCVRNRESVPFRVSRLWCTQWNTERVFLDW